MKPGFDPRKSHNRWTENRRAHGHDPERHQPNFHHSSSWVHSSPPWWPEGEPWPPAYRPDPRKWRRMRGHIYRRVGCFLFFLLLLASGMTALLLSWISSSAFLGRAASGPPPLIKAGLAILLLGGLFAVLQSGRNLRSTATQVDDTMDAISKLAGGDYSVRINERGQPEDRALARAINSLANRLDINNQQRRQMLADVTHELRTPLTVIQGDLEGMLDGIYAADPHMLQAVLDETHTLSRIIDDLRTLSLAESGSLKLQLEQADPAGIVVEVVDSFKVQANTREVSLVANTAAGLPALECDPVRIHEVLGNLVNNALRYTPPGGKICVGCALNPSNPEEIKFSVTDTGSGIPGEDLPHIFDRFYKSANSSGSGLGLAISKSLVQAHGGEIYAESPAGQGTAIYAVLPINQSG